jgi:hypothetical protein
MRSVVASGVALAGLVAAAMFSPAASSRVVLSSGTGKIHCRVPKVVGLSLGVAEKKIHRANCRVGAVRFRTSTLLLANQVLDQRPMRDRKKPGTEVVLVVGRGPKTGRLPDVGRVPRHLPPYIAYDPPGGGIWLVKPDGSGAHQIGPPNARNPVWSPDAKKILYQEGGGLGVMNADGTNQQPLMVTSTCTGDHCWVAYDFHWSPDGQRVTFVHSDLGILVANADGSDMRHVADASEVPSFSPDGSYLIFAGSRTYPAAGLFVSSADGTASQEITFGGDVASPSWSPGGRRVVYGCLLHQGEGPGAHAICELSAIRKSRLAYNDGRPARQRILYMDNSEIFLRPTWNTTGTKILVTVEQSSGGPSQIALMSPSGGAPVKTGIFVAPGTYPDW